MAGSWKFRENWPQIDRFTFHKDNICISSTGIHGEEEEKENTTPCQVLQTNSE